MEKTLTYSDFANINNFASLIRWFNAQDYKYDGIVNAISDSDEKLVNTVCKNDFSITYQKEQDEFDELFFFKHFINSKVEAKEPLKHYKKYIEEQIDKNFKYSPDKRRLFIKDEIRKLESLLHSAAESNYLEGQHSNLLCEQLSISINWLHSDNSLYEEKESVDKIKVKLSRNQLTCLFFLLRQAGLIDHKYDNDLGRLIETNFQCFNNKKESYVEMTTINKLLSDFKNGNKSMKTSSETLKKILSNPNFYELLP